MKLFFQCGACVDKCNSLNDVHNVSKALSDSKSEYSGTFQNLYKLAFFFTSVIRCNQCVVNLVINNHINREGN